MAWCGNYRHAARGNFAGDNGDFGSMSSEKLKKSKIAAAEAFSPPQGLACIISQCRYVESEIFYKFPNLNSLIIIVEKANALTVNIWPAALGNGQIDLRESLPLSGEILTKRVFWRRSIYMKKIAAWRGFFRAGALCHIVFCPGKPGQLICFAQKGLNLKEFHEPRF